MKKTLFKNILLLSIMLALLILPVQAALIVNKVSDEFSIESPYPVDSVKACECGTRTEIIEVKNLGDFDTLYKVNIDSPIKDRITLSEDTFNLAPGKIKKVFVYINAPCDTSVNTFYIATVCTNYGRSKEIYKNFVSQKCQNIKAECNIENTDLLPGNIATIKVALQNVGEFEDTFTLAPQAYKEFTTISQEKTTLGPDEKKNIFVYVQMPLSYSGSKIMPISIVSEKSNNIEQCVQSFSIASDYDYSIKADALELGACEDLLTQTPITFENLAQTPNKYYMFLTAPPFINLSQKTLSLDAGEKGSVLLNINPTQQNVGTYNLILSAKNEYGGVEKQKSFKLTVNNCFESSAKIKIDECGTISCPANPEDWKESLSDKACTGEKKYVLNVRNDGTYEETYEILIDSEGWVSIDKENQFVKIKPSQQINIPVKAKLPDMDEKQTSFIIVKQLNAPRQTSEIKLELESMSERSCYNVEMLQESYSINYESTTIPLLLKNTGLAGGTYKITLGELESRFVYLDDEEITFQAGEMKTLRIAPKDFAEYKQGTYLNKLTLKISPVDKDITYDRQFWVVLKDKSFIAKAIAYIKNFNYSRIGWCGLATLVLIGILIIAIIVFAYMKLKKELRIKRIKASKMKKIKNFNIFLIGLLIVGILVLFLIGSPDMNKYYEQSSNETSPIYHEWKQNTPYQVELSQYFADPDTDVLSYTASQPDHIQIKIEGSHATLTPEFGWSGEEYIVFTANDAKGGITDSDVMTLKVLKRMPAGFLGMWNTYCSRINIVLIMLIIVVGLLMLDIVEDKGYNYYNPRKNKRN